jgi:NitT/TauT family transport system substrate-binding protein
LVRYPDRAKIIVKNRLGVEEKDVARIWSQNAFSLSLDQSLIIAMEDEARWMMQNNLTAEKQMPDFRSYIYIDGLKAVKPEAVNIR